MLESSSSHSNSSTDVLIVLMGALGDVVRGLAVPTAIKADFPDWRITWLVEPKWQEIVELHPCIDEVLVFNRPKGLSAVLELRRELSKRHFDLTLDLQRHLKSGLFSYLSGAQRRIGFHARNSKEGNWIFNTETIDYIAETEPKLKNYLSFAHKVGVNPSEPPRFGLEQLNLSDLLSERSAGAFSQPAVSVVLGSSWPSKDWIPSGYSELTRLLLSESGCNVVFVGDPRQAELAQNLSNQHQSARVHNLVGSTSVKELLGVLSASRVAVGPDSGPGHIASAVGTPYVSLFGPTDPRRVAPHGGLKLVVSSEIGCMPCNRRECPGLDKLCMRLISPRTVFQRIEEAISERSGSLRDMLR